MDKNAIIYEKKDRVGIITLNHPSRGNRITAQMAAELKEVSQEFERGSGVNVIIITGSGNKFSIGTDEDADLQFEDRESFVAHLGVASTVGLFVQPVIAAINGDAFDQGLELALACDLRLCAHDARFAMPQILRNEIPFDGGTQRLPRLVGRIKAMEMILHGEIIASGEAQKIGLVNKVLESDRLMPEALEMAKDLSSKGPMALRYAKEAVLKGMDLSLEQGLRLEADLYFLLHTMNDRIEGITAFKEKRKPRFDGT